MLRSTERRITIPLAQWLTRRHSVNVLGWLGFELESSSEPEVSLGWLNFSEVLPVTELHEGIGRVEIKAVGKGPTTLLLEN